MPPVTASHGDPLRPKGPIMDNPLAQIPAKVRATLYIVYGVGSIVLTYLAARGIVGSPEVAAWTGLGAFFGFTAVSNLNVRRD